MAAAPEGKGTAGKGKTSVGMLTCGLTSGLVQAGLFNPWDRALYLSIKDNRTFLHMDNFRNPFSGLMQTIVQRALSTGLYFPLEELYRSSLSHLFSSSSSSSSSSGGSGQQAAAPARQPLLTFLAGMLSGITSGVVMNPISAVKYHYWGTPTGKENFFSTSADMWRRGGLRIFVVGTGATVNRDLVFGGVYAYLRHELVPAGAAGGGGGGNSPPPAPSFLANLVAACSATIISSPWNYVRNVHYATQRGLAPEGAAAILRGLWAESLAELRARGVLAQARFLQTRLRIGWGTVSGGRFLFSLHFTSLHFSSLDHTV